MLHNKKNLFPQHLNIKLQLHYWWYMPKSLIAMKAHNMYGNSVHGVVLVNSTIKTLVTN